MADDKKEPGKDAAKNADKTQAPNADVSKKRKLFIIAGIGGILLLSLAAGLFFMLKSKTPHPDAAAAEPEAASSPAKPDEAKPKDDHDKKDASSKKEEAKKPDEHGSKDSSAKKDEHASKDEHGNEAKKEDKPVGTENFGSTFNLPKMELNLGNPIENRYLRISVSIEYRGGDEQGEELKKREAQLKDIVITSVTTKTRAQLLGENGKELLRREMLNKINEIVDKPVQNIFYTDFLVE